MRLLPILTILVAAVVIAGCAKKDDTGGTTTPTPTPSTPKTTPTATPTTSTPSGTTPTSPTTPTTPTTPTPVAPKQIKAGSVSWPDQCSTPATAGSAPQGVCPSIPFTIDPGYTTLNLTVTWSCAGGAPACGPSPSGAPTIAVGSLSCVAPQIDPTNPVPPKCIKTGTAASGKIVASGDGAIVGTYSLTEQ